MQIDFSRTDRAVSSPSIKLSCLYHVVGDSRYRGIKKFDKSRVGYVAVRTYDGCGIMNFHNGESFELPAHSLFVVPYVKISDYRPEKDKWSFWWFEFESGDDNLMEERVAVFDFAEKEAVLSSYILETLREKSSISCEEASAAFGVLMCFWKRHTPDNISDKYPPCIRRMAYNIRRYPEREHSVEAMSKECSLSVRRFRDLFSEYTGCSPKVFIVKVRMEYAGDLLLNTLLPIVVIAEKCGYPDRFYFSRAFAKYWGTAPARFREIGG